MKTLMLSILFAVALAASVDAAERECVGLKSLKTKAEVPCGSLQTVLAMLANWNRTGGRKLEGDKPFDPAAAQASLDKALQDPAVRDRLEEVRRELTNERDRLLYEAAILDDEGHYDARNLRIHQLRQLPP